MPEVELNWVKFDSKADFVAQVCGAALELEMIDAAAEILTAQAAHETDWGRRTMNWNLAGVKANRTWQAIRDYCVVGTKECVPCMAGEEPSAECPPGQIMKVVNGVAWRAFDSATEGVNGVLTVLGYSRYAKSKSLLLAGNTDFFKQLGADGWYTASPDVYHQSSMHRLKTVRVIRCQLALLEYYPDCLPKYGPDGSWGEESQNALVMFQKDSGLPVTGKRDKLTLDALFTEK